MYTDRCFFFLNEITQATSNFTDKKKKENLENLYYWKEICKSTVMWSKANFIFNSITMTFVFHHLSFSLPEKKSTFLFWKTGSVRCRTIKLQFTLRLVAHSIPHTTTTILLKVLLFACSYIGHYVYIICEINLRWAIISMKICQPLFVRPVVIYVYMTSETKLRWVILTMKITSPYLSSPSEWYPANHWMIKA